MKNPPFALRRQVDGAAPSPAQDGDPAGLGSLAALSSEELRAEWCRLYRVPPPPRVRRELLLLGVAWKRQERALGGLGAATQRRLAELAGPDRDLDRSREMRLKPGARLLREWRGETHSVLVLEDGFAWRDQRWRSLSEIACAITGAHWSGPRFFGLTQQNKDKKGLAVRKTPASEPRSRTRCAVYTRKSSEDGLEQDFNSLDAQREACAAFIASQRHEGWLCLPQMYDDGGISGATLQRPALQRLLADIEGGRIDTVVVYKVDRLTRSLHDFARLVEVFDRTGVSFVSVTQAFNTTTSMGRLTLNMLLTFGQFEREVTAERIRDKIAASKQKGLWMGGLPPLGYDVRERKLVVNAGEAETVRAIFGRYARLGCVGALKEELDRDGIVSKQRCDRFGRGSGGVPLPRTTLYRLLQNRLYRGEVVHQGTRYPGVHQAIIDAPLWDEVQRALAGNRSDHALRSDAAEVSLLAGRLFDHAGVPMTPSHANKRGRRYRYYVSRSLISARRTASPQGRRVPAGDIEAAVEERVCRFLADQSAVLDAVDGIAADLPSRSRIVVQAAALAAGWRTRPWGERHRLLQAVISRVDLGPADLAIHLRPAQLPLLIAAVPAGEAPAVILTAVCALRRVGLEMRLLIEGSEPRRAPDHRRLLAQAHRYRIMVLQGDGRSISALAAEAGVGKSWFTRVLRLSFLSPDIVSAVLADRHPIGLNAQRLARLSDLPAAWPDQRARLGLS